MQKNIYLIALLRECSKLLQISYEYHLAARAQMGSERALHLHDDAKKNLSSHRATDIYSLPLSTFVLLKYQNRIHFVIAESL